MQIESVHAERLGGKTWAERIVGVYEDGTKGILIKRTLRRYEVVALHAHRQKSGATEDCPEASYFSFHARPDLATPRYKGDVLDRVYTIQRKE